MKTLIINLKREGGRIYLILRNINRIRLHYKEVYRHWRRRKCIAFLESQIPTDMSIIASNCFAGRIYQDLKRQYTTPTAGLFIPGPDYIVFLNDLKNFLTKAEMTFTTVSRYPQANEDRRRKGLTYPIGVLNGTVEIHFLHFHSEEEARDKWMCRAERVNFKKLMIIGMQQNWCRLEDAIAFDTLPYKNKYFFSTYNIENNSNIFMHKYVKHGEIGNAFQDCRMFYEELIKRLNNNESNY